jgi:hypothetical protein
MKNLRERGEILIQPQELSAASGSMRLLAFSPSMIRSERLEVTREDIAANANRADASLMKAPIRHDAYAATERAPRAGPLLFVRSQELGASFRCPLLALSGGAFAFDEA